MTQVAKIPLKIKMRILRKKKKNGQKDLTLVVSHFQRSLGLLLLKVNPHQIKLILKIKNGTQRKTSLRQVSNGGLRNMITGT